MKTPFYDAVARATSRGPRFFVPGHKGNTHALPPLAGLLSYDLTEIQGLDDLQNPDGPLAESQANMTRAYGFGATLYSASGSTNCILAMMGLFCAPGDTVVMARGCHVAAVRGLALLDLSPWWVPLQEGRPHPRDIDAALSQSGAKTVYVTGVDYYGRMPDIPAIAEVCRRHGAALLCDNAHGAYLRFLPQSRHPISLGAQACADSAHKTLPCLTPAALLHLQNPQQAEKARAMLNLFSSTSPSYPVLASLDLAAGLLLENPPDFAACALRLAQTGNTVPELYLPCDDPLRLRLCPPLAGIEAGAFTESMREQGVYEEYFDGESLVYMATPSNTEADFCALEKAISHAFSVLPRVSPGRATPAADAQELPLPQVKCRLREAFFSTNRLTLPVEESAGRIMAGLYAPCPPGVPLVMPGEAISCAHAARLSGGGILQVDVLK